MKMRLFIPLFVLLCVQGRVFSAFGQKYTITVDNQTNITFHIEWKNKAGSNSGSNGARGKEITTLNTKTDCHKEVTIRKSNSDRGSIVVGTLYFDKDPCSDKKITLSQDGNAIKIKCDKGWSTKSADGKMIPVAADKNAILVRL